MSDSDEQAQIVLTDDERLRLTTAIHHRDEWEYGDCDHGTYWGGPSHGQPYAMCERAAGESSIIVGVIKGIVRERMAQALRDHADREVERGGHGQLLVERLLAHAEEYAPLVPSGGEQR